jgi:NAD(P)-dependent dehydrogenase (short-subunit alcohol dehydrogenase family)
VTAPDDLPVVLVTGAAGGIGGAVTARFAAGGWRVFATDRSVAGLPWPAIAADVRRPDECRGAIGAAVAAHGRLDALVNCAGVWHEGPAETTTEAAWDEVLDVNLKGTFFCCAAAVPHLRATRGGIVNISSDAGIQGNLGAAVYCASKGGVSNLTRALALELAPHGVRVNAVCPGDVDSPMLRRQAADHGGDDPDGYLARLLSLYPQGAAARFTRPDEVAELVWFLAQPHAAPITGANLTIDFGLSAGT